MAWRTLGRILAWTVPIGLALLGWVVYQQLNASAVRATTSRRGSPTAR